jgi:hypothetical protein
LIYAFPRFLSINTIAGVIATINSAKSNIDGNSGALGIKGDAVGDVAAVAVGCVVDVEAVVDVVVGVDVGAGFALLEMYAGAIGLDELRNGV